MREIGICRLLEKREIYTSNQNRIDGLRKRERERVKQNALCEREREREKNKIAEITKSRCKRYKAIA